MPALVDAEEDCDARMQHRLFLGRRKLRCEEGSLKADGVRGRGCQNRRRLRPRTGVGSQEGGRATAYAAALHFCRGGFEEICAFENGEEKGKEWGRGEVCRGRKEKPAPWKGLRFGLYMLPVDSTQGITQSPGLE